MQIAVFIFNSEEQDIHNMNWTVKMWHFGRDALTGYSVKQFQFTWEDNLNVFHRIYSKEYKKRGRQYLR